jgi:hypothetical protein
MAFDPGLVTREDAQRRVDRIRAFREELAELERLGVVALDGGQQDRLRRFHEEAVASLASRFDVDSTEAERRLSLGMRVASFLGAIALSAAVYFFFYRFWGSLSTGAQVVVLAAAPLAALAGMELAARKERTLYVAGILGLVAVACFVLDLNVLGAIFNLTPSPGAFLAWAAFAGLLAYAYGLRLLLLAAIAGFTVFFSSQVAGWSLGFDCSYPAEGNDARERHGRMVPRRAYVLLEYDGPAWHRWLEASEAEPDRKDAPSENARVSASRLVSIDVGRDPDELRRLYPDRSRCLIVPAIVAPRWTLLEEGEGEGAGKAVFSGRIQSILVSEVHVPKDLGAPLAAFRAADAAVPRPAGPRDGDRPGPPVPQRRHTPPRYEVLLRYGAHHEPWVAEVRPLP